MLTEILYSPDNAITRVRGLILLQDIYNLRH